MSFQHFLITRFNISVDNWKSTKNGHEVLTDEWHEHRFNLFENYCVPSVKNQSENGFKWIVCFSTKTKPKFRKRINELNTLSHVFYPLFTDKSHKTLDEDLYPFLRKLVDTPCKFFLTTRIDNDDILHKDFIATIQQNFIPQNRTVIDLRKGFQLTLQSKEAEARAYYKKYNHFISVIFKAEVEKTVYARKHFQWWWNMKTIRVKDIPLWIELVHEMNLANKIHEELPAVEVDLDEFNIEC